MSILRVRGWDEVYEYLHLLFLTIYISVIITEHVIIYMNEKKKRHTYLLLTYLPPFFWYFYFWHLVFHLFILIGVQ